MARVCLRTPIDVGQYRRTQALQVVTAVVSDAVYIERGGTLDSATLATGEIPIDAGFNFWCGPVASEAIGVQAQLHHVAFEICILERLLVLEQVVVHCPEVGLSGSRFGGGRRGAGMRVNFLQREMPEDEPQAVGELALELVDAVA